MGNSRSASILHVGIICGLLLIGVLSCLPIVWSGDVNRGYKLLVFDSALGIFDEEIGIAQQTVYMKLWKRAKRINYILNPGAEHGRGCGTFRFLKSEKILVSPYLSKYTIFLVSPGLRPCDFDETCEEVSSLEEATCAHTQYLKYFPVIVDPVGTPYHKYTMDIDFFNALIKSENLSIKTGAEALELVHLFIFLSNPKRQIVKELDANVSFCEKEKFFKVKLQYRKAGIEGVDIWEGYVDFNGFTQCVQARTID